MDPLDEKIVAVHRYLSEMVSEGAADEALNRSLDDLCVLVEELIVSALELRTEADGLRGANQTAEEVGRWYRDLFDRAPDGYVLTDLEGDVLEANRTADEMFAEAGGTIRSQPLVTLVAREDRKTFRGALADVRRGTGVREVELRMHAGAGETLDVLLHVSRESDPDGDASLRWHVIDISDRQEMIRELRRRDALLEAAAAGLKRLLRGPRWELAMIGVLRGIGRSAGSSRAYVVETEDDGRGGIVVRSRSEWTAPRIRSVVEQLGSDELVLPGETFGHWFDVLGNGGPFQVGRSELPAHAQALLDTFGIRSLLVVPIVVERALWGLVVLDDCSEERSWAQPEVEALSTAAEIIGAVIHRSEMEQSLVRSEQLFRRLAEDAQDVVYRYRLRPQRGYEYVSPAATAVYGYTPEEHYEDPELAFKIVHPDDEELLRESMNPTVRTLGDPVVFRSIHKDGSTIWTEHRSVPVLNASGTVVAIEGIARDVTERKHAEAQLVGELERQRETAARIRAVDEAKSVIVEAASHDLRAPLSSLLGFALTLQSRFEDLTYKERSEILDRMVAAARRLDRGLEADLTEIQRVSRGIVGPIREPTDLSQLAHEVVSSLDAPEHEITLDLERLTIDVDPVKVERIIENLLSNAMKHTPPGSHIWLRLQRQARGARLVVEDDGPGVPDDDQDRIFGEYERGAESDEIPGLGVGLSLVQRLAEMHGGDAWVEPRPGGGSSFVVTLDDPALKDKATDLRRE